MATVTIKTKKDADKVKAGDQIIFELKGSEKIIEDETMEVVAKIAEQEDAIMGSINERLLKEASEPDKPEKEPKEAADKKKAVARNRQN